MENKISSGKFMKIDRSPGASHVIDSLVDNGWFRYLPLSATMLLIYKHCPVSRRNIVFSEIASRFSQEVAIFKGCACGVTFNSISSELVDCIENLRIPDGILMCEKYDYVKVAICDFIYSKFYSMFN